MDVKRLKRKAKSILVVAAAATAGLMIGNLAGNAFSGAIPFLSRSIQFGLDDFSLELYVARFHVGLMFEANVPGLIGGTAAAILALKL